MLRGSCVAYMKSLAFACEVGRSAKADAERRDRSLKQGAASRLAWPKLRLRVKCSHNFDDLMPLLSSARRKVWGRAEAVAVLCRILRKCGPSVADGNRYDNIQPH